MIFKPDLAALVLEGRKTQTRRPANGIDPCRYVVGRTYAVQPGRGEKALGRVLILSVTRVPVVPISAEDAAAEGFRSPAMFYVRWDDLYGYLGGECWRIAFELAAAE